MKALILAFALILPLEVLSYTTLGSKDRIEEYIILQAYRLHYSANKALAIAGCESNLRQFNMNNTVLTGIVNNKDIGIFQINEKYHLAQSIAMNIDIYTAKGNIDYGLWLLETQGDRHFLASKPCWKKKLIIDRQTVNYRVDL